MNIFSWPTIDVSCVKIFSRSSRISYWSKTCSDRSGLSIALTLDRFGVVHVKKDTIEKGWTTIAPIPPLKKKRTGLQHKHMFLSEKVIKLSFPPENVKYEIRFCVRFFLNQYFQTVLGEKCYSEAGRLRKDIPSTFLKMFNC